MRNFKNLIKQANKEIEKIIYFIKENEEVFESTNLKLYDIAWNDYIQKKYDLDDDTYSHLFNMYCEDEYRYYEEWREEEKLQNEHSYIGRTSSFYFHNEEIIQLYRHQIDYTNSICACIDEYINMGSDLASIINEKGLLDISLLTNMLKSSNNYYIDGYIEQMKYDLMDIVEQGLFEQVIKDLDDTLKDYQYIKGFKENQVENFKDYIESYMECVEIA